jgi:methylated-DNA-protein-cysteine methyltransferase-like protein
MTKRRVVPRDSRLTVPGDARRFFSDADFRSEVIRLIKSIPKGRVATYGQIASLAGHHLSVRRVVWILHSCSRKEGLPWYRVVNRRGAIALRPGAGYERQKELLEREGVVFDERARIDLERFLWEPDDEDLV